MKIKVVKNMAQEGEGDISHMIGKEFSVLAEEGPNVYIRYGPTNGGYLLRKGEFEVVEETQ